jgi:hypothetical protein
LTVRNFVFRNLVLIQVLWTGVIYSTALAAENRDFDANKEQAGPMRTGGQEELGMEQTAFVRIRLGAAVQGVTLGVIQSHGVSPNNGVIITWLDKDGLLSSVGFEVKDIILEVNGRRFSGAKGFMELIEKGRLKKRITLLAVDHRSGRMGYVQVVIP